MKLIKTNQKGIYYVKNLENITYYGSFKNPLTKQSKRVKLLVKDKYLDKYSKECIPLLDNIKKEYVNYNTNEVTETLIYTNYKTLSEIGDIYFKSRVDKKTRLLKELYNHLTKEEFEENRTIQRQIYTTKKEKLRFIKNLEDSEILNKSVNKINKKNVNDYINIHLANKNLSQKSKFNVISLIKTVFNYSIKSDIINIKNPFENIIFKNPKRKRIKVLSENELILLLEECKKEDINVYLSVYLGILTGGRKTSILNIRKKDIDVENGTITLTNFKVNNRNYTIKINENGMKWLKEKVLPFREENDFIVQSTLERYRVNPPQPLKDTPMRVKKIMDILFNENLNKQNNLDRDYVVNFHTLRRTIGTHLIMNGTTIYNVMILLNHSSIQQTMDYLNITFNDLNNDLENFHNKLFGNIKRNKENKDKNQLELPFC